MQYSRILQLHAAGVCGDRRGGRQIAHRNLEEQAPHRLRRVRRVSEPYMYPPLPLLTRLGHPYTVLLILY